MSNKKNTSLAIGAFLVGAILLVFVALLFFSGGRLFAAKERVVMYFDGSVQGLQVGAPVKLKGVILGEIIDIQLNFESDNQTVVTVISADLIMSRINSMGENVKGSFLDDAVANGLRAQLNYQSLLTGLLYVELDFFADAQATPPKRQETYPEIPTRATSFEEITKSFQELDLKGLVDNLNDLTEQIGNMVSEGNVQQTLVNFNRLTYSVEKTSNNLDREVAVLSKNLNGVLAELDTLLKELNTQAPKLAQSLDESMQKLHKGLDSFDAAAANINNIFSEDAVLVNQLNSTLDDISRSAQAFRTLSETLEQQPEALLRGKKILSERE